jgi:hypothetical protein
VPSHQIRDAGVGCKKGKTMTDATYNVMMPDKGVPIKAWTKGVPLEDAARQQLLNVAQAILLSGQILQPDLSAVY